MMLIYVDQKAAEELQVHSDYRATKQTENDVEDQLIKDFLEKNIEDLIKKFTGLNEEIPGIVDFAYKRWDEAYHCFLPKVNVFETIKNVFQPVDDYEIYICGSSYSNKQSWAEGALLTSEYLLQEIFNIEPNQKVPPNYVKEELFK